jgi:cyclophilin family peptidyl-prolyl cis-trans isomerase
LYQYEQEHQKPPQRPADVVDLAADAKQMLRKREADVARMRARMEENEQEELDEEDHENSSLAARKTLVLTTALGPIRIQMRPDMSPESVDYIERLVESGECTRCSFYRAEQQGILQGVVANKAIRQNTVRGPCPPAAKSVKNDCPKWDLDCGCHGPVMIQGAVAWAGGTAGGPDFFINAYPKPAQWWGTQHTNFGFVGDKPSMDLVQKILHMPVKSQGGMHLLKDQVQFRLSYENTHKRKQAVA